MDPRDIYLMVSDCIRGVREPEQMTGHTRHVLRFAPTGFVQLLPCLIDQDRSLHSQLLRFILCQWGPSRTQVDVSFICPLPWDLVLVLKHYLLNGFDFMFE